MLRLFRNIRQRLFLLGPEGSAGHALSGKVSRYLGYAIGEILLIVVGILIALQISNWNERQIQKELARSYILALQSDFMQNEELIKSAVFSLEGTKRAAKSLSVFIEKGFIANNTAKPAIKIDEIRQDWMKNRNTYVPITDRTSLIYNLDRSGFLINFDLILPTWNEIINSGNLKLIENEEMKKKIAELYFFAGEYEDLESDIWIPVVKEYQDLRTKYYDVSKSRPAWPIVEGLTSGETWIDFDGLRTDNEVMNHLQRVFRTANEQQANVTALIGESAAPVIEILNEEIRNFD